MALHNPRTGRSVEMGVDEFKKAVVFLCDPSAPLVTTLPYDGKTVELIQLMNPRPSGKVVNYFFPPPDKGEMPIKDMGDKKEHFDALTALQTKVNFLRESLKPLTSMPAAKNWTQTLTFSMLGNPPDSTPTALTVSKAAPPKRQVEARRLLEALTDNVLVSWNEKGALVDPRNKTTLQNTNVYNIIRNLYSINSPATAAHISRYEPTGLTFFVDRIMKLTADNGDIPKEVVDSIRNTGRIATGRWTERECNGRRYNLLKMFSTLTSFVPKLLAVFKSVEIFIAIMLTLGPISWSWFCYGYDWLASIGVTNRLTAYGLNTVRPLLEKIDGALPDEVVGAAQGAIVAYGDQIPMTVLQTVMAMTASAATAIFTWAICPIPWNLSGYFRLRSSIPSAFFMIEQFMVTRPSFTQVGSPKMTGPGAPPPTPINNEGDEDDDATVHLVIDGGDEEDDAVATPLHPPPSPNDIFEELNEDIMEERPKENERRKVVPETPSPHRNPGTPYHDCVGLACTKAGHHFKPTPRDLSSLPYGWRSAPQVQNVSRPQRQVATQDVQVATQDVQVATLQLSNHSTFFTSRL
ncbi:hypothetical protein CAPTEDRAFT_207588 [Capitella teleta]|uniref:Uncharacterized protein n=1 Tax=Capitella teleta TaxID=283909 RepID=R7TQA0_CAPTE|nr:hypothetical protein CAPTEDRAFT_207588 [Capitella teleta]|eukprot:ELT93215.1 hypothetical protein CAPTEDRAFT_207588 [Capitella teleta]